MKCEFCVEEIKDEAILCRFCGATKGNGVWRPPKARSVARATSAPKGRVTIRCSGVLFILAALFELFSITSEIPLFGELRGGIMAFLYHTVYIALFLAVGIGLWVGKRWGYWIFFAGTIYYTLDRIRYLLDRKGMEAHLMQQLQGYTEIFEIVEKDSIIQTTNLTTALFIICWWIFALYIYLRRDTFKNTSSIR